MAKKISPIKLAVIFHEIYERLAPKFGYETKEETKIFNASTPNGKLMIEVCREMQDYILERTRGYECVYCGKLIPYEGACETCGHKEDAALGKLGEPL